MFTALQNSLLFFPGRDVASPGACGLKGVEEVRFPSSDGVSLFNWWLPPPAGGPTVMYFQGNAGCVSDRCERVREAQEEGWGMLVLGYRGYGRSEGAPSEEGIYRDTRAGLGWLRGRAGVDPSKLVYYGESLGCAFASELAAAEKPAGVILAAPFRSLRAIASVHYPWLPVSLLVRGNLDNEANVKKLRCPVFVSHGKRDEVIPFQHGRAVFDAAPEPKTFYELDCGHCDIPEAGGRPYRRAVGDFIRDAPTASATAISPPTGS